MSIKAKYIVPSLLFMGKTMPQVFFMMALPAILRREGHSLTAIGLLQLINIPYLIKFAWAPMLDRKGQTDNHYKRWTLWSGLAHGLMIIAMAFLSPAAYYTILVYLLLATSFAASTQDIAISALYIKLLDYDERGIGASSKIFALNLGTVLGSGLLLILYNYAGWTATLSAMGLIVLLTLVSLPFLEEKTRAATVTATRFQWGALVGFFRVPGMGRWTLLMIVNSISTSAVFFMIKPFLVDRGVGLDTIAFLVGFYGMGIAAGAAMLTGNSLFQRYLMHRRKAYIACALMNAVVVALYLPIAYGYNSLLILCLAVGGLNTAVTISSVVSGTLIMDFSRRGHESIDYSVQITALHLGGLGMAAISGWMVEAMDYPAFFGLQAIIGLAVVFLTFSLFRGRWVSGPSSSITAMDPYERIQEQQKQII